MNQPNPTSASALEDVSSPTRRQVKGGSRKRWRLRIWLFILLLLSIGVHLFRSKFSRTPPGTAAKVGGVQPPPVVAAKAHRGSIPVYFTGLGAVTPINTVTLKSRVDGQLMKVLYKEGDMVQKGALLVEIDSRPFQVQ